ncbi:cation transporter [Candidatus Woesebacteria bacterium]|nr:cation transporter [Candidatus Woesebacteria bacterium]
MWPFKQKKKLEGEEIIIKIDGMHCTSCALTIDEELEEIEGVHEARSSYAKGEVRVRVEPGAVQDRQLRVVIEKLGYKTI